MGNSTDAPQLIEALNRALPLQLRDSVATMLAAATLRGPDGVALAPALRGISRAAARDCERVAARIATLGGTPRLALEDTQMPDDSRGALERLAACHRETLTALVEAIPADADDVEGEATEHLLEHAISRKRDALELLERALR